MNAVEYIGEGGDSSYDWGWRGPGWYYWDETWSWAAGPYATREAAAAALRTYATDVLGI